MVTVSDILAAMGRPSAHNTGPSVSNLYPMHFIFLLILIITIYKIFIYITHY